MNCDLGFAVGYFPGVVSGRIGTACYWVEMQNERFPERIAWRLEAGRVRAIHCDC